MFSWMQIYTYKRLSFFFIIIIHYIKKRIYYYLYLFRIKIYLNWYLIQIIIIILNLCFNFYIMVFHAWNIFIHFFFKEVIIEYQNIIYCIFFLVMNYNFISMQIKMTFLNVKIYSDKIIACQILIISLFFFFTTVLLLLLIVRNNVLYYSLNYHDYNDCTII
jgi:hypothetical protein